MIVLLVLKFEDVGGTEPNYSGNQKYRDPNKCGGTATDKLHIFL